MESGALLAGGERLPEAGALRFGIDCQMLVSGFDKRIALAEDDRSLYAGKWRLINEAIASAGSGGSVDVFEVNAHRK